MSGLTWRSPRCEPAVWASPKPTGSRRHRPGTTTPSFTRRTSAWPLFLSQRCQLAPAADIARELLGRTASPRLVRALFDVEELLNELPGEASIAADVDLVPIRPKGRRRAHAGTVISTLGPNACLLRPAAVGVQALRGGASAVD